MKTTPPSSTRPRRLHRTADGRLDAYSILQAAFPPPPRRQGVKATASVPPGRAARAVGTGGRPAVKKKQVAEEAAAIKKTGVEAPAEKATKEPEAPPEEGTADGNPPADAKTRKEVPAAGPPPPRTETAAATIKEQVEEAAAAVKKERVEEAAAVVKDMTMGANAAAPPSDRPPTGNTNNVDDTKIPAPVPAAAKAPDRPTTLGGDRPPRPQANGIPPDPANKYEAGAAHPPKPTTAPAPTGGAYLRPDEGVGPQRDKSRLSIAPAPPSVARPATSRTSGPTSGPTVKTKPGGQRGANRKLTSEVGEGGTMGGKWRLTSEVVKVGTIGGWNSVELANSEVVGLDEVVLQSRMRRAYARLSSLNLAPAITAGAAD